MQTELSIAVSNAIPPLPSGDASLRQELQKESARLEKEVESYQQMAADLLSERERQDAKVTRMAKELYTLKDELSSVSQRVPASSSGPRPAGGSGNQEMQQMQEQLSQLTSIVNDWYQYDNNAAEPKGARTVSVRAPVSEEGPLDNDAPTPPNVRITTSLKTAASKGDTKLAVTSTKGLKVGLIVRIGDSIFEEVTIKGFRSIIVDPPLRMDHPLGAAVTVVGNRPAVPVINLFADEDDEEYDEARDDAASASPSMSDSSVDIKHNSGLKNIAVPAIPKYRSEVRTYHMKLVESVLQVSTRPDEKENIL